MPVQGSVRTCIGCRRRAAPRELVRLVRTPDGRLEIGTTLPGRGAWLCRSDGTTADGDQAGGAVIALECLEAAARRQAFNRAFRAPVDGAAMEALRAEGAKRARIEEGRG